MSMHTVGKFIAVVGLTTGLLTGCSNSIHENPGRESPTEIQMRLINRMNAALSKEQIVLRAEKCTIIISGRVKGLVVDLQCNAQTYLHLQYPERTGNPFDATISGIQVGDGRLEPNSGCMIVKNKVGKILFSTQYCHQNQDIAFIL